MSMATLGSHPGSGPFPHSHCVACASFRAENDDSATLVNKPHQDQQKQYLSASNGASLTPTLHVSLCSPSVLRILKYSSPLFALMTASGTLPFFFFFFFRLDQSLEITVTDVAGC